jgi:hypothetical protein
MAIKIEIVKLDKNKIKNFFGSFYVREISGEFKTGYKGTIPLKRLKTVNGDYIRLFGTIKPISRRHIEINVV